VRSAQAGPPKLGDGFAALCRLTGLTSDEESPPAGQRPARADNGPGIHDLPTRNR